MADLVGRTISAATNDAPSRPQQVGSSRPRTDGPGVSVGIGNAQLYSLVETAMMNMPNTSSGADMKPTEAARVNEMLNQTWETIRKWLAAHPREAERRQAALYQGQFLTTALHMVCKLTEPPVDVVRSLIECAEETVTLPDSNGWLPLHHACANTASGKVLSVLVDAYPEGRVQQDKRFRTPLHFAFFRKDNHEDRTSSLTNNIEKESLDEVGGINDDDDDVGNSMPEIVTLLADSGAAELQDEGGMLPLHYASAYGTTPDVLEILLESYPESITKRENKGRNALHLAMVNAHRNSSPKVVEFLLQKDALGIINCYDDDRHLPIHLLAMASKFPEEKVTERSNAAGCLNMYLDAKPKATADFLTATQTLPEWLRDIAVISDHLQDILNHKIVMRFPTMILILDAFFLILVIVMFEIVSGQTIDHLFTTDSEDPDVTPAPAATRGNIMITLVCGAYFLLREVVQIISLLTLGNVGSWFSDMLNWLDVALIFSIFYYGAIMLSNEPLISKDAFKTGVTITKGIMWNSVIGFLKSTKVEFSVFVSGVFYVLHQLAAFLLALGVIVLMFTLMFNLLYAESEPCQCNEEYPDANQFPHCTFGWSLMKIYTMMMGEIGNEMRYSTTVLGQIYYYIFAFILIILLSNVLIAIVTDSYGVIKNERAAMVFWSNRLDFVAEMDSIKNINKKIAKCFRSKDDAADTPAIAQETPDGDPFAALQDGKKSVGLLGNTWNSIMNLFDSNLYETYDVSPSSIEFWCYVLVRFVAVVFVIPVWLIMGFCTAGWLWPPQVREYILKQEKVATTRADLAEEVTEHIHELKTEIKKLQVDMKGEMKNDRKEFLHVKAEVEAVQKEVMADLLQVKEIMQTLLDMSRDHLDTAAAK